MRFASAYLVYKLKLQNQHQGAVMKQFILYEKMYSKFDWTIFVFHITRKNAFVQSPRIASTYSNLSGKLLPILCESLIHLSCIGERSHFILRRQSSNHQGPETYRRTGPMALYLDYLISNKPSIH